MQMKLPIYPVNTQMITTSLGVYRKDGLVIYLHCGVPIHSHTEEDNKGFRYITSKFVLQGLCRLIDISNCFHVSYDSVKRYVKKLEEGGERVFFGKDGRRGSCYKLVPVVIERIQKQLDSGKSNSAAARNEGITEGAIRYALKKGGLKKKASIADAAIGRNVV